LRPGRDLATDLKEKLIQQGLESRFSLKMMQCMSVCSRPATCAFVAPGKFTFTIGDLNPETAADDIIIFAEHYAESPDGIPAWSDRPEQIRKGTISRTPSFSAAHQRITPVKTNEAAE
jgi:predicted metal-binding protein